MQYVILFIFSFCSAYRLWLLQVMQSSDYALLEKNRVRNVPILAPRGKILDREGRIIVDNYPSFSALLLRDSSRDLVADADLIAQGLHLNADEVRLRIKRSAWMPQYQPIFLKEDITPDEFAATMVAAGVYLVARIFPVLTPDAKLFVAIIGCTTLTMAALIALAQSDIKKVLAFSTLSQLGYMIMAMGVGSWVGGMFHLITHAFFKSLLFLGSGSVIAAMHHEQEMPQYGGLMRKIPLTADHLRHRSSGHRGHAGIFRLLFQGHDRPPRRRLRRLRRSNRPFAVVLDVLRAAHGHRLRDRFLHDALLDAHLLGQAAQSASLRSRPRVGDPVGTAGGVGGAEHYFRIWSGVEFDLQFRYRFWRRNPHQVCDHRVEQLLPDAFRTPRFARLRQGVAGRGPRRNQRLGQRRHTRKN